MYVRIISWHIISEISILSGRAVTRCGRLAKPLASVTGVLPADEKSCETCLRLARHDADKRTAVDDAEVPA